MVRREYSQVTRLFRLGQQQVGTSWINPRWYCSSAPYLYLHDVIPRPCPVIQTFAHCKQMATLHLKSSLFYRGTPSSVHQIYLASEVAGPPALDTSHPTQSLRTRCRLASSASSMPT
jgi:hypothetical protein